MIRDLDLTLTDNQLAPRIPVEWLCAIRFASNRKRNFDSILSLVKSADVYLERTEGKHTFHFAGFARTDAGARLAHLVLTEMREGSWKFSVFANEKTLVEKVRLVNVLSCYSSARQCRNPEAHCQRLVDDALEPDRAFEIDFSGQPVQPKETWVIPCKHIEPFLEFDKSASDPRDYLEAVAIERTANLCPFFRPEKMRRVDRVTEAKRYW